MSCEYAIGEPILDSFPAFEDDGITKRSGLSPSDFTVTLFKDNAVDTLTVVTIDEIGSTGEYGTQFTPMSEGFYRLEVLINFSGEIWRCQYCVIVTSAQDNFDLILAALNDIDVNVDSVLTNLGNLTASVGNLSTDVARVLGLLHDNAIVDNQTYDATGQLTGARLRIFDSLANVPDTPGGSETAGLLFEYEFTSQYGGQGIQTLWTGKRIQ